MNKNIEDIETKIQTLKESIRDYKFKGKTIKENALDWGDRIDEFPNGIVLFDGNFFGRSYATVEYRIKEREFYIDYFHLTFSLDELYR